MMTDWLTPVVFEEHVSDEEKKVTVSTRLNGDGIALIEVRGMGSVNGMNAAAQSFERGFACLEDGQAIRVLLELTDFQGAPLRAQLQLLDWMLKHQKRFDFMIIAGGDTRALKIARKVQSWLPFGKRIVFVTALQDGLERLRRSSEGEGGV